MGDFFRKLWQNKKTRFSLLALLPWPILLLFFFLPSYLLPSSHLEQGFRQDLEKFFGSSPLLGSTKLSLLPRPEFIIKDVMVRKNEVNATGLTLAKADLVKMTFSFWSYLKGDLKVDLVVEGLVVHIRQPVSWFDLVNLDHVTDRKDDSYRLGSIKINQGELHLASQDHGQKPYIIDKIDLLAAISDQNIENINLEAKAILLAANNLPVGAKGLLKLNQNLNQLEAEQLKLNFGETFLNLDGWINYKDAANGYKINLASAKVDLLEMLTLLPTDGLAIPKNLQVNGPMAMDVNLHKQAQDVQVKIQADAGASQIIWSNIFSKPKDVSFKIILQAKNQKDRFIIDELTLFLADATFVLNGFITKGDQKQVELKLVPNEFQISSVADFFPSLPFIGKLQAATAELSLTSPKLKARLQAEKAQILGQEMTNLETILEYENGQLILNPFQGELYGGALSGNITASLVEEQTFESELVIDDLDVSRILPFLQGTGSLVAKGKSQGQNVTDLWQNMEAGGTVVLAQGQLKKISSLEMGLGNEIDDLRASFNYTQGQLTISNLKWRFASYEGIAKLTQTGPVITGEATVSGEGFENKFQVGGSLKELLFLKTASQPLKEQNIGLKSLPVEDIKPARIEAAKPEPIPAPKPEKSNQRTKNAPAKKEMLEDDLFKVIIGD
ncbi:MAG: hypothetical protein ABH859_07855 [Pseudomonadota bacterium]